MNTKNPLFFCLFLGSHENVVSVVELAVEHNVVIMPFGGLLIFFFFWRREGGLRLPNFLVEY